MLAAWAVVAVYCTGWLSATGCAAIDCWTGIVVVTRIVATIDRTGIVVVTRRSSHSCSSHHAVCRHVVVIVSWIEMVVRRAMVVPVVRMPIVIEPVIVTIVPPVIVWIAIIVPAIV